MNRDPATTTQELLMQVMRTELEMIREVQKFIAHTDGLIAVQIQGLRWYESLIRAFIRRAESHGSNERDVLSVLAEDVIRDFSGDDAVNRYIGQFVHHWLSTKHQPNTTVQEVLDYLRRDLRPDDPTSQPTARGENTDGE
jgi:hypothetical protein